MPDEKFDCNVYKHYLKRALQEMYQADCALISRNVGERALTGRLQVCLDKIISNNEKGTLAVDCEYDCNGYAAKKMFSQCNWCMNLNKVVPCFASSSKRCYTFIPGMAKMSLMTFMENSSLAHTCRPDIILHGRGSGANNILVIEVKKSTNRSTRDKLKDKAKLAYFTCKNGGYQYKLGAFVEIGQTESTITWIEGGNLTATEVVLG